MTTYPTAQRARRAPRARLPAPSLAAARDGVIDPAWNKAVLTVKPYPKMTCGDELLLRWHGLNNEGEPYRHEVRRFVTERQVGSDIIFVVREPHIAELDGGSLEISYRVAGRRLPVALDSEALQLQIGDAAPQLLAAVADDAVGGALDPQRVPEGTRLTIRPYARMAVGDRLVLTARRETTELWHEVLDIEAHAVGGEVSFWIDHGQIAPHAGHTLALAYSVGRDHSLRHSAPLALQIGALERPALKALQIRGLDDGTLDIDDLEEGLTVVIDDASLAAGEWVWLQCDGSYTHSEEREITEGMAGAPLTFVIPARFWQTQRNPSVRLSYQVERLDDVSQHSGWLTARIRGKARIEG